MSKFIIEDWAGNVMFEGKTFSHFEDAWDFIYSQEHLTEDDYQEFYVLRKGSEIPASVKALKCDMYSDCSQPISHVDEKGFLYCATHGVMRRQYGRCRRLRPSELRGVLAGKTISKY